jgi:hypothetical protein
MKALILLDVPLGGKLPNEIGVTLQPSQFSFNFTIMDEHGNQIGQFAPVGDDVTIEKLTLEYKNTTIERMQAEHDDALEAKSAEMSRLNQLLEIERAAPSRRTHRGCFG